jgi:hypothetical protein
MNRWKLIPVAVALMAWIGSPSAKGAAGKPERYRIDVSLRQGDPDGSREAGTLKVLAEPTLVTRNGQEASYVSGGEAPVGGAFVPLGATLRAIPVGVDGEVLSLNWGKPPERMWVELSVREFGE